MMERRTINEVLTDEDIDSLEAFKDDLKSHLIKTGFDEETIKEYFSVIYTNEKNRLASNRIALERNELVRKYKGAYTDEIVQKIEALKKEREVYYSKFNRTVSKVREYDSHIKSVIEEKEMDYNYPQLPRTVDRLQRHVKPTSSNTQRENSNTRRR